MAKYILSLIIISLVNVIFLICYIKIFSVPQIAVVNISKIIEKSEKIKEIRADNNKKLDELEAFIEESRKKIQQEKNKEKKEQLINQYQDIARQKEDIIKQNYNAKIKEADNEISEIVQKIAKSHKINAVLLQSSVLQGGIDITDEVLKKLSI